MKDKNPLNFMNQLEEYYNISSPSYKFQFKCDNFQVNSKEELLQKHLQQKQNIINLHKAIKQMNEQRENLYLIKNNIESKFKKIVSLKRHGISVEDVDFNKEKINTREKLVLNNKYVDVLKDINELLIKLKIRAKGMKL